MRQEMSRRPSVGPLLRSLLNRNLNARPEAEKQADVALAKSGDRDAFERVVGSVLPFIIRYADRLAKLPNAPDGFFEDLVQECIADGVPRSIEGFRPEFGYTFLTYAGNNIRQSMSRYLDAYGGSIVVPDKLHRALRGQKSTANQDYVPLARAALSVHSLDEPLAPGGDSRSRTIGDTVVAPDSGQSDLGEAVKGFFDHLVDECGGHDGCLAIPLKAQEWDMLRIRMGRVPNIPAETTIRDIATAWGVSHNWPFLVEKRLHDKLRRSSRLRAIAESYGVSVPRVGTFG